MPVAFWNDQNGIRYQSRTSKVPGSLATRRQRRVHRTRQPRHRGPLRRDPQPRRRTARHRRVRRRAGGATPKLSDSLIVHLDDTRRRRWGTHPLHRAGPRAALDDDLRAASPGAPPRESCRIATCPDTILAVPSDPVHPHRKEARDPGETDPPRPQRPTRSSVATRSSTPPRSTCSPRSPPSVAAHGCRASASRWRTPSRSTCTRTPRSRSTAHSTRCRPSCARRRGQLLPRRVGSAPNARDVARGLLPRAPEDGVRGLHGGLRDPRTGRPPVPNEEILEVAAENSDVMIAFASIDPHKDKLGVREARRLIGERVVRGFKFHPTCRVSSRTTGSCTPSTS